MRREGVGFPWQQWLRERVTVTGYMCAIACRLLTQQGLWSSFREEEMDIGSHGEC